MTVIDEGAQVAVMRLGVSGLKSLAQGFCPGWSPDGRKIVYVPRTQIGLRIVNDDGTDDRALPHTEGLTINSCPSWSPNGTSILFAAGKQQFADSELYATSPDGGLKQITSTEDDERDPDWAPDGRQIVFTGTGVIPGEEPLRYPLPVSIMNADGTGVRRLPHIGDEFESAGASWSPDGRKIVFTADDYYLEQVGLWTMNADGSQPTLLYVPAGYVWGPAWQPVVPTLADFKNTAGFCKAERKRLGPETFRRTYRNLGGCVSTAKRVR